MRGHQKRVLIQVEFTVVQFNHATDLVALVHRFHGLELGVYGLERIAQIREHLLERRVGRRGRFRCRLGGLGNGRSGYGGALLT